MFYIREWKNKAIAKEILCHKKANLNTSNSDEIKNVSKRRKKQHRDGAGSCRNNKKRLTFKKERNKTLKEIKRKLNEERNKVYTGWTTKRNIKI